MASAGGCDSSTAVNAALVCRRTKASGYARACASMRNALGGKRRDLFVREIGGRLRRLRVQHAEHRAGAFGDESGGDERLPRGIAEVDRHGHACEA